MATTALQRLARRAILARLKADANLTAIVPAASIYGQSSGKPGWPFVKLGPPTTVGRVRIPGCAPWGRLINIPLHGFAGPVMSAGTATETAEDHAGRLGGALEAVLDTKKWKIDTTAIIQTEITDMQLLQDGDEDHFHYVGLIAAKIVA